MRKKLLVIMLIILLAVSGCSPSGRMAKKDPQKIIKLFEQEQAFVLYISRKDCDTCKSLTEVYQQLTKSYPIDVYYIAVNDEMVEDADMNMLINNYLYRLEVVPTTYLVNRGKIVDLKEGFISYDEMVEWLGNYGYINR